MTRLPLRTMIVLVCLGIVALISITVPQTFSKSLVTPRVSSFLAGASTPIHAKSLMTPRVSNALQVAAGEGHTCAIQTNGSVKCWGANWVGQLGYGDSTDRGDNAGEMGTDLPIVDLGTNHTATQISSGFAHTCVILDDGTLKCWGYNNYGQLGVGDKVNHGNDTNQMGEHLPIINLGTGKTALAVSAGKYHTCAILNDHTLKCWGNGANGQLGYVDNLSLDTPSDNPVDLGNNRTALAVSAGEAHTCAILDDATVRCWGYNGNGQLGLGNMTQLNAPSTTAVNLGTNRTAIGISSSVNHTCVVLDNGQAKCWGANGRGQLGQDDYYNRGDDSGEMGDSLPAIFLGSGRTATAIDTGGESTCAILDNNTVKCWGFNEFGQLGQGDQTNRGGQSSDMANLNAINVGSGQFVSSISIGGYHICAVLTSTNIKCWGNNDFGQLGIGNTTTRGDSTNQMGDNLPQVDLDGVVATATPTPSKTSTRSLTPSRSRTPTKSRTRTATPVGGAKEVVAVSSGGFHTCVILANDTVKCWGLNDFGQLGLDEPSYYGIKFGDMTNLAIVNLAGHTAKSIEAAGRHTCVILENNTVKCWGNNSDGELGYGDATNRGYHTGDMAALQAIDLGNNRTALTISSTFYHTCAILDNHKVKCWGSNESGQLGLGDTNNRGDNADEMGENLPYVDLGTGHTAKSIHTGKTFTCAVLEDDTVKCWGNNVYGQLGLGDSITRGNIPDQMGDNLPILDFGTRRVKILAISGYNSCALFDSGTVSCWGWNKFGQLGQGDVTDRGDNTGEMGTALTTIDLGSGHTAKAIMISTHVCAILDDDSLKCWGNNDNGQLGYGDTNNRGDTRNKEINNEMGDYLATIDIGTDLTVKSVSLGQGSTCVILNTNNLKCWGYNGYGELGYNNTINLGTIKYTMGNYLPPVVFGVVLTSTPTYTPTKSSTPTKTATSTKSNTPTKTATRTKTFTMTATKTKTATSTKTPTHTKTFTSTTTSTGTATSTP